MASPPKHHLSFTDHLSLYLPSPLRPPLPRDLRPPPTSFTPIEEDEDESTVPPAPQPTPTRTGSSQSTSDDDEENNNGGGRGDVEHGISPTTLHHGDFISEKKSNRQRRKSAPLPRPQLRLQPPTAAVADEKKGGAVKAAALSAKLKVKSRSREGYHVSLILANSGSVARDHLASERTFLAYVRTSLALASTGVALVQLFTIAEATGRLGEGTPEQLLLRRFATPVGSTMIVLGVCILFLGGLRYFAIQMALTRGAFPASRMTVMFLVVTLSVLIGTIFGVLLKGRPRT